MAITIKHLIQEARAQGGPSRLNVNGRELKVEIIHGTPHVTVDRMPRSQAVGQELLDFAYLVESVEKKKQETPQAVISIYQMLVIRDRVCGKQVQDIGGYRFEVDRDEQGRPKYLVNGQDKTLRMAEAALILASRLSGATIQPHEQVSPTLYLQQVGRAYRQPRNEAEVHEIISRLLTDLSPTLFGMLNDHMFPKGDEAEKLRNLLHLNEHGTFPLATN